MESVIYVYSSRKKEETFSAISSYVKYIERIIVRGGFASNVEHIGSTCTIERKVRTTVGQLRRVLDYADPGSEQYRTSVVQHSLRMPYRTKLPDPIQFIEGMVMDGRQLNIAGEFREVNVSNAQIVSINNPNELSLFVSESVNERTDQKGDPPAVSDIQLPDDEEDFVANATRPTHDIGQNKTMMNSWMTRDHLIVIQAIAMFSPMLMLAGMVVLLSSPF
ncbi:unnamed protein product [Caenorhabditis bovis]|uniref:Uncharacterized protein n=1 Tax=Caenorhabditis bovis TaxID=2654633 RepID=A0A8S1F2X5_9PELO|nr:unnamed protein product [Caenorhabditis bovis]